MNITTKTTKAELIAEIERLTEKHKFDEPRVKASQARWDLIIKQQSEIRQLKQKLTEQSSILQRIDRDTKIKDMYPKSKKAKRAARR